jgi:flavin-dependent dehydrogenase
VTPIVFERHPELRELRSAGRPASSARLRTPDGRVLSVDMPEPIDIFSRRTLDGMMLERALAVGALHRAERVRRVTLQDGGVRVECDAGTAEFDFAVGADGVSSIVRRSLLGEMPGGRGGWAAAGFYVEGLEEPGIYIEFLSDVKGYIWNFPRADHGSVGVVAPIGRESGSKLRQRVLEMLDARYPGSLSLPREPYGMSIPSPSPWQGKWPRLGGAHFALIGDAANLVDSITGEGIHYAIDSAAVLSDALHEAGPREAHRLYRARWRAGPGRQIARSAHWAAHYYHPWLVDRVLGLAHRSSRMRRIVADLLMVKQPYTKLFGGQPSSLRSGEPGSGRARSVFLDRVVDCGVAGGVDLVADQRVVAVAGAQPAAGELAVSLARGVHRPDDARAPGGRAAQQRRHAPHREHLTGQARRRLLVVPEAVDLGLPVRGASTQRPGRGNAYQDRQNSLVELHGTPSYTR